MHGSPGIHRPESDLIDTLWNVKAVVVAGAGVAWTDLIDTLWNVKLLL